MTEFTTPQCRALLWLPRNGDWMFKPPGYISAALHSLRLYHPTLIDDENGPFGPRGGYGRRVRLTSAGRERSSEAARIVGVKLP
jgi:hypothetical protein